MDEFLVEVFRFFNRDFRRFFIFFLEFLDFVFDFIFLDIVICIDRFRFNIFLLFFFNFLLDFFFIYILRGFFLGDFNFGGGDFSSRLARLEEGLIDEVIEMG